MRFPKLEAGSQDSLIVLDGEGLTRSEPSFEDDTTVVAVSVLS